MSRRIASLSLFTIAAVALAGCAGTANDGDKSDTDGSASADYSLVNDGTLTVATEGTYRPFSFHEGGAGALTGYDVEIITAVADKLGLKAEFKETQWDAIFAGLDAGRFDVIANQVTINDERSAKYLFSEPYTVSPGVIIVADTDDSIASFEDLADKSAAQSLSSNWYELATDSGAKVEAVEGWAQAIALLEDGRVDATINDKLTYLDYVKQSKTDPGVKVAAETPEAGEQAFAFVQADTALAADVDKALEELRADGTLTKISEKYFGEDVSQ